MKKFAILLLCLTLVLSFSACNKDKSDKDDDEKDKTEDVQDSEDNEDEDNDDEDNEDEDNEDEDENAQEDTDDLEISNGDYSDFQTALTTFTTDYLNTKTPSYNALDATENADELSLELLGLYMVDLIVAEVPMYDALDLTGSGDTKVSGSLMLSGFEATKEKDGDKIKFGYTHTYEEEGYGYEVGDIDESIGYLDTKKNVLVIVSTRMRAGQLTSKTIMEIARLKDDSFVMQNIHYDSETSSGQSCIFLTTTTDSLTAIIADGEPSLDFKYSSLIDKANVTTEEMAAGYTISKTVKVKGSEVVVE